MGNICFCNKNYLTQDELNKENELDNKAYRELQKKIFDTLEIDIRDDKAQPIPFDSDSGKVMVKLHFRRRR